MRLPQIVFGEPITMELTYMLLFVSKCYKILLLQKHSLEGVFVSVCDEIFLNIWYMELNCIFEDSCDQSILHVYLNFILAV